MPSLRNRTLPDPREIALSSRQTAITMARKALDAKAEGVVILDLRKLSYSFDFFVLCTAESDRRVQTIAEDVREALSNGGERLGHEEGRPDSGWTLLDYGPVVCHIFAPEMREFYGLERLWADAPRLKWNPRSR